MDSDAATSFDSAVADFLPAKRRGAADEAVETIKAMIVDGRLGPHQRMPSEPDLARLLRVSRPTIREATRALVALNILEARHGDGTYVTSLAPELLAQPIDFLLGVDPSNLGLLNETIDVLEASVAALAATHARDAEIAAMEALVKRIARAESAAESRALDREFHELLRRAARSPILTTMVSTAAKLAATNREPAAAAPKGKRTPSRHRAIVAALKAHDADAAQREMARHMGDGCWAQQSSA